MYLDRVPIDAVEDFVGIALNYLGPNIRDFRLLTCEWLPCNSRYAPINRARDICRAAWIPLLKILEYFADIPRCIKMKPDNHSIPRVFQNVLTSSSVIRRLLRARSTAARSSSVMT